MSTPSALTDRPDFMKVLGLLPPYSDRDVEAAYSEKLTSLELDAGPRQRHALEHAHEQALDFTRFRESRRKWAGRHVERYTAREAIIERIRKLGGTYLLHNVERYLWAYGEDFAEIMRQLVRVELIGPAITDAVLDCLNDEGVASEIVVLVLRNSTVTDAGLSRLAHLKRLRCLDLRNTAISNRSLKTLSGFTHLEWLQLHGTRIGFWTRRRLRGRNPHLHIAAGELDQAPPVYDATYEHVHVTERIAALQ